MLTPEQITKTAHEVGLYHDEIHSLPPLWILTQHELERFAHAIEAEVRQQSDALIQPTPPTPTEVVIGGPMSKEFIDRVRATRQTRAELFTYDEDRHPTKPAPLSERAVFEATWEKLHGKRPVLWSQMFAEHKMETPAHSEGRYFYRAEQAAWELWQARAALTIQGGA